MKMMMFERFAAIEGDEAVGIRASVLRCETIAAICMKVNLNLMQLFRGPHAPSRAVRGALAANLSANWYTSNPHSGDRRERQAQHARARALPRIGPFLPAKLCLIPPFSP